MASFEKIIKYVLKHEGGYVDDPRDAGGATKYGITLATLRSWRGKPIAKQDVKDLTEAEATAIYRANYWAPVKGDDLPAGVDYVVFDAAVNSGPKTSVKWLQRAVGVNDDGIIGPKTLTAVRALPASAVINKALDIRLAAMRQMKHPKTGALLWPSFGRGWASRVASVRAEALAMAAAA